MGRYDFDFGANVADRKCNHLVACPGCGHKFGDCDLVQNALERSSGHNSNTSSFTETNTASTKHKQQSFYELSSQAVVGAAERAEDSATDRKGKLNMNVASAVGNAGGDRSPNLDEKLFKKLKDGKGFVTGKVLSVKGWRNDSGITIELKNGSEKFVFLTNFDGYDIAAIVNQLKGATETDDWIGESIKFTTNKGKDGKKVFVNAWNPMSKKNSTATKRK